MTQPLASLCLRNKRPTARRYSRLLAAANSNTEKTSAVAIEVSYGPEPGPFYATSAARSVLHPFGVFALLLAIIILDIVILTAAIQPISVAFLPSLSDEEWIRR